MSLYDIRNPRVHVPLSLTDTCQLFLSITERGQKDHIEYGAVVQILQPNDRSWPVPASRSAAHSTRPMRICSGRYGADSRLSI